MLICCVLPNSTLCLSCIQCKEFHILVREGKGGFTPKYKGSKALCSCAEDDVHITYEPITSKVSNIHQTFCPNNSIPSYLFWEMKYIFFLSETKKIILIKEQIQEGKWNILFTLCSSTNPLQTAPLLSLIGSSMVTAHWRDDTDKWSKPHKIKRFK